MKFLVVLFWSLILSQVAGFIISKLNSTAMNPSLTAIIAVAFTVFIFVLDKVGILPDSEPYKSK